MVGKSKIDLRAAEEVVRDILQKNVRATNAEIGLALGVCAETAGRILRKLSVCGPPDVQELLDRRYMEIRSRWWARRDVSPAEIVRGVKSLAEKLGRTPRTADAGHLAFQAIEVFGTWNAALAEAGLPLRRVTLPGDPGERREVLVSALKEAAGELGRVPTAKQYDRIARERSLPKSNAVTSFFGSWRGALEAAGLVRSSACEVQEMVERALSDGKWCVSAGEVRELPPDVRAVVRSRASVVRLRKKQVVTWLDRAAKAGFPEVPGLEEARSLAERFVSGETYESIAESTGLPWWRVKHLIGKYAACVMEGRKPRGLWAGIDRDTAAGYVLKAVRDLGRVPTRREYDAYCRAAGGPPSHVLVRIFGSWRGVLGAAVFPRGDVLNVAAAEYEGAGVPEGTQV
ncbi:hypothetical protein SAMN02745218_02812 [Desulfofundulus australicus DSM 11792]|uniref:Uncharacterized protein n=1 Tax=Desulfofundulus australicus DSM 11792 TaxID=1121425 RepID=A0A1M5DGC5_9FIRM|nr:hypothetical protein [Desulfofundulus australicus]SHF65914.1 hypothetical protein SAMN02745218_02812 [Desulfofundulus australicus DSM 11792]